MFETGDHDAARRLEGHIDSCPSCGAEALRLLGEHEEPRFRDYLLDFLKGAAIGLGIAFAISLLWELNSVFRSDPHDKKHPS